VEGHTGVMNGASLVKQVIAHVALEVIHDLDEPVAGNITVRHVLSHTTGLPNWRPDGGELRPIRPPGERWGYSGEGFVSSNVISKHAPVVPSRPSSRNGSSARSGCATPVWTILNPASTATGPC